MSFERRLKMSRELAKLSQEDVARRLGVTRQAVGNWESEKHQSTPDPRTLAKLAEMYGVSVDWLLGRAESVVFATRGMPLPPPGAENLTPEELEEINRDAAEYHEYIVRKRLREKGIDV